MPSTLGCAPSACQAAFTVQMMWLVQWTNSGKLFPENRNCLENGVQYEYDVQQIKKNHMHPAANTSSMR